MLNRWEGIGHLGRDPETRTTQSGQKVVNLSLAVSERWKSKDGEKRERTEWVNVVIWNEGLASVAEKYLSKGSKCFVAGQLQTRKWQDQAGADRYSTEVVLQNYRGELVLLGERSGDSPTRNAERGQGTHDRARQAHDELDDSDSIPF